jgi:hypothetical protein
VNTVALFGEVNTSLLQTSTRLSPEMAVELLRLQPGEPVRARSRPVQIAWSPDVLTGVDCEASLPPNARRGRLVGTLRSSVSVTEGQLLQVATSTVVRRSDIDRRRPWPHYLAEPGTVELLGPVSDDAVATGFLTASHTPAALDLAALNGHLLTRVQKSARLDRQAPFRARRTRVRWVARIPERDGQHVDFTIGREGLRTLSLQIPARLSPMVSEFCADLALHDWLLSNLRDVVDRALTGPTSRQRALQGLRPVIENLAHIWMPGARVEQGLAALWADLESRARLSTQWETTVARVRDYIQMLLAEGLLTAQLPGLTSRLDPESAELPGVLQER